MHRALLTWVLLASACVVSLDDHPGRACDATHPCRAGRDCVDGFCDSPDELDAGHGADAGAPDGGTP